MASIVRWVMDKFGYWHKSEVIPKLQAGEIAANSWREAYELTESEVREYSTLVGDIQFVREQRLELGHDATELMKERQREMEIKAIAALEAKAEQRKDTMRQRALAAPRGPDGKFLPKGERPILVLEYAPRGDR